MSIHGKILQVHGTACLDGQPANEMTSDESLEDLSQSKAHINMVLITFGLVFYVYNIQEETKACFQHPGQASHSFVPFSYGDRVQSRRRVSLDGKHRFPLEKRRLTNY